MSESFFYIKVYDYYKKLIVSGKLPEHAKMPSIRKCALQFGLSKTTIETAYFCLAADGYIISKPQSGYYVTPRINNSTKQSDHYNQSAVHSKKIKYDFTSNNVDEESFDFNLWRRYVKSALRQDKRLLSYGEPQGEYELRETICDYVMSKRNAVCSPDNIVIGAGSQSLLNILCPLINSRRNVCFHDSDFMQGKVVFQDYGFNITDDESAASIVYMTPSNMTTIGDVMSVENRISFLRESITHQRLIIEDDYNNEFRYFSKPKPCLQGLAGGENVVYLSTFSKLLLPSIRLSFMILPNDLLHIYQKKMKYYNQTASKAEQLALCQFLRDGHLDNQLRKLKRLYSHKTKVLAQTIDEIFGSDAICTMSESITLLHLKIKCNLTNHELCEKAKSAGILLIPSPSEEVGFSQVALSCCEVPIDDFKDAILLLKSIV